MAPHPSPVLKNERVLCPCGAWTLAAFTQRDKTHAVCSCWITLDDNGFASPGCVPNDRTDEVIERRNARLRDCRTPPVPPKAIYAGSQILRCACGRVTRALTSNINDLAEPVTIENPPDAPFKLGSSTCWLAIAEDGGPSVGCAPEDRTWEILGRRRGVHKPQPVVAMQSGSHVISISAELREKFEEKLRNKRDADAKVDHPQTPDAEKVVSLKTSKKSARKTDSVKAAAGSVKREKPPEALSLF